MSVTALNTDLFAAAVKAMPADNLSATRAAAAGRFLVHGFPTSRDENWKYTNLSKAADISNAWLLGGANDQSSGDSGKESTGVTLANVVDQVDAHWIIVRNGYVDSDSIDRWRTVLPPGIEVLRLSELADGSSIHIDDSLSAFNAALLQDGLLVRVAEGVCVTKPIGIVQIDDPSLQAAQSRIVLDLGTSSGISVVECALSHSGGTQFSNSVTEARIAPDASLSFVRLQLRDENHVGVNRMIATVDRRARFCHNAFDFGGSMTRNDIAAVIAGSEASVDLRGLYLASGEQHIDNHTRVEHRVGPASSDEEYRGVLNGRARCVFNGQAVVFAGADGTDANQANHNLLLSERAEVDTKPELEIYADDVKCSHGATVGQLDDAALFYLRSRGLEQAEARHLLTRSFAATVLGKLAVPACGEFLATLVDHRLSKLLGGEAP